MHATGNAGMWRGNYDTDRKRGKINKRVRTGHWYLREKCTLRFKL